MLEYILFTAVSTVVHSAVSFAADKATKGTKVSLNPIRDSDETLFRVLEIKYKE